MLQLLSKIGAAAANKKYIFVVDFVSKSILNIMVDVMKQSNQIFQEKLDRISINRLWYFSTTYPKLFNKSEDLGSYLESNLPNYITIIGLEAIKLGKNTFLESVIDILFNLARYTIQFDEHGYTPVRITLRILMIKMYACYTDNISIASKATEKIKELTDQDGALKISESILNEEIDKLRGDLTNDVDDQIPKDSPQLFLIENIPKNWRERKSEKLNF